MSDYAIYGKISDSSKRLMVINESDWTVESNNITAPLTNLSEFPDNNEYWVECTTGKKVIITRDTDGEIESVGDIDSVLYWSDRTNNTYWQTGTVAGLTWAWGGSSWSCSNSTGSDHYVPINVTGSWAEELRFSFYKLNVDWSGTTPSIPIKFSINGSFCDVSSSSVGGRSNQCLSETFTVGQDLNNFYISVPNGQTVTINGIYISDQEEQYTASGWANHTKSSRWTPGTGVSWNNDGWNLNDSSTFSMDAVSNWDSVGKPTAVKISFSPGTGTTSGIKLEVLDTEANKMCDVDYLQSDEIIPVESFGYYVDKLNIQSRGGSSSGLVSTINDVQFYYGNRSDSHIGGTLNETLAMNDATLIDISSTITTLDVSLTNSKYIAYILQNISGGATNYWRLLSDESFTVTRKKGVNRELIGTVESSANYLGSGKYGTSGSFSQTETDDTYMIVQNTNNRPVSVEIKLSTDDNIPAP